MDITRNILPPEGKVDVVLDTDAFNEIDDQFAIAYLLRSENKLNTVAFYAAPFFNSLSNGPADGMEKSYHEIIKLLELCDASDTPVFKGSESYLPDEKTPVYSPAALDLAERAMSYSAENPLYVVAIGAITNVASAILIRPEICDRIVLVWLGGHAHHWDHTAEFNMKQDYAAARVVMRCTSTFVQLPCFGVVSEFRVSEPELRYWLEGKNPLADYLAQNTIAAAQKYAKGTAWTRVIWDVTAIAWLLNEKNRFMQTVMIPTRLPGYDHHYEAEAIDRETCYVYGIHRDRLMTDLFEKILKK